MSRRPLSVRLPRARSVLTILGGVAVAMAIWALVRSGTPVAAAADQPYHPCPSGNEPCRVLPLGDSLTWGIGYDGGYRVALFEQAHAAGKRITFTGTLHNGPELSGGRAFSRNHEGRSGWKIEQITGTVPLPALETLPHIVLLHVGTNDVYAHEPPEVIADRLDTLLDRLRSNAPRALIVVAEIVPLTDPALNGAAERYNAELRQRVQARRARGEHVLSVDQFSGFPTALLSDGVHPTQAGYERMAAVWFAAIAPYLP